VINWLISSFVLFTTEQSLGLTELTAANTAAWETTKKTARVLFSLQENRCITASYIALISASKSVACFPKATLPSKQTGMLKPALHLAETIITYCLNT
jgi:hypothetical protein